MIFGTVQTWLFLVLSVAAFAAEGWALIDALRHRAGAYVAAGKNTKPVWITILTVAIVIGFLGLPYPIGIPFSGPFNIAGLAAIAAAIIYLAGVRPAVRAHRQSVPRKRGRGRKRDNRGGW